MIICEQYAKSPLSDRHLESIADYHQRRATVLRWAEANRSEIFQKDDKSKEVALVLGCSLDEVLFFPDEAAADQHLCKLSVDQQNTAVMQYRDADEAILIL